MKRLTVLAFVLLLFGSAKAQTLAFTYDAAGNQTERTWVCVSCATYPVAYAAPPDIAKIPQLKPMIDSVMINKPITSKLTVYPNPVTETLFMRWESADGTTIRSADAFTMAGVKILHQDYGHSDAEPSLRFTTLSAGFYVVRITYSTGRQEMVKVVKQ